MRFKKGELSGVGKARQVVSVKKALLYCATKTALPQELL
jgi:hypothetical protein